MKSFLLDTQPAIHEITGQRSRLGRGARRILEAFDDRTVALHISALTLLELWNAERRGKVRLGTPLGTAIAQLQAQGLVVAAIEPEDVIEARGLAWDHRDPYDRIIVATALRLRMPLVTGDRAIRAWRGVESVW